MKRTNQQNKLLHGLIKDLGINSDIKAMMVSQFTNQRTESTAEMLYYEVQSMIEALQRELSKSKLTDQEKLKIAENERAQRLRRTLISAIYNLPERFEFWTAQGEKKKFNARKFDEFLLTNPKSPFPNCKLNQLSVLQLTRLIAIINQWNVHYNKKNN